MTKVVLHSLMYIIFWAEVKSSLRAEDLYLQTTPFMQAQYYYDYIYYGIYRTDLELGISR